MRKRNIHVQVWLNESEADSLTKRAKESGYSREAYIRSLINGRIPKPMPPPDYHAMMRELHAIGNNLNQIAHKAHALNMIDAGRYDIALTMMLDSMRRIEQAVILPTKVE